MRVTNRAMQSNTETHVVLWAHLLIKTFLIYEMEIWLLPHV